MAMLGSIGVGLVWGWLLAGRRASPSTVVVLIAATMLVVAEAALLAGPHVVPPLLGAALGTGLIRATWRARRAPQLAARTRSNWGGSP
jgi:hypothetical protein